MTTEQSDNRFITLLLANQCRVYRFLFTLVPRREDVEDLFQQTCLTLWQERARFDPEKGAFASWACAIAQNHVRNFRRRESTRQALLSEEVAELLVTTQEAGGRFSEECHLALQHCLNRLPPHQMALVEESYREGTLKSTAAAAGRSVNALYKSLRRIRAIPHDCMLTSRELLADSTNERVTSLILWYDATSGRASLDLQHSFDFQPPAAAPAGWQGAFQKDADGLGYTLEYAIPWRLLHCESDPPRAGDVMGALWTVHWSDADGRICFGQLIDVTNQNPPAWPTPSPVSFFLSGPHWGRAVFQ